MNRAFFALGLVALLAAPAAAGSIGFHASWWDADEADDAAGAGAMIDFRVGRAVDFEVRATFFDDQETVALGQRVPFRAAIIDLGVAYNFVAGGGKITPYVGGGASFYVLDVDQDRQGRLDDEAGWYGLLGVEAPVSNNWVLYVEGMWREAEAQLKGNDLGFGSPVNQGFDMRGPTVNLGVAFRW